MQEFARASLSTVNINCGARHAQLPPSLSVLLLLLLLRISTGSFAANDRARIGAVENRRDAARERAITDVRIMVN